MPAFSGPGSSRGLFFAVLYTFDPARFDAAGPPMELNTRALVLVEPDALPFADTLVRVCSKYEINSLLRQSHFLSQMAVESGGFTKVVESLNYREDKLVPLFGISRISEEQARRYGRSIDGKRKADQEALANILYGGSFGAKQLGNIQRGDGWRFRGRGLKQITGRANYHDISVELYGDDRLLQHPEWLERNEDAAWSAGAFWHLKGLNKIADTDDVVAVTKKVNGGSNGLQDRKRWLRTFKKALAA